MIANTEIVTIDRLSFLCSNIKLENNISLKVSAVYRSHDMSKTEFTLCMEKYLQISLNRSTNNHVIIGHFNVDILYSNLNSSEIGDTAINEHFLINLLEHEFSPSFVGITRPSNDNRTGTCIDNMYIKSSSIKYKAYKLTTPFNDHYPLLLALKNIKISEKTKPIFKPISYTKMYHVAKTINWNALLLIKDPDCAIEKLIELINECTNNSVIHVNKNKNKKDKQMIPRKKWITNGILISCRTKESLFLMWRKNPNCELLKTNYKNYTKILSKVIKDAKMKSEKEVINANADNPRKLWNIINTKLGKNVRAENNVNYIIKDNQKLPYE